MYITNLAYWLQSTRNSCIMLMFGVFSLCALGETPAISNVELRTINIYEV